MSVRFIFLGFVTALMLSCSSTNNGNNNNNSSAFELVTPQQKATIIYDKNGPALDSIVAHLLAQDIELVSGYKPKVTTDLNSVSGNAILIGNQSSELLQSVLPSDMYRNTDWETYTIQLRENPFPKLKKALIIAGADPRGTAYGVFSISEKIGVSPWYWWADAIPQKQENLVLNLDPIQSKTPAVKFRGIFINDEDWGLQPWAEKTFEPETGDIGPKTYAKIFELLLRLRANTIWPAMHPGTRAFFHYPGNVKMVENYEIVLGSSHAEPMLRNNVDEWDHDVMGDFNYFTNRQNVLDYWEQRVAEAKKINGIYTLGMRGIHDSGMEGAKTTADAAQILNQVIGDQRKLLEKNIGNVEEIPQVFTVYKEVLDVYEYGLELPEDITLMWTDDNNGYIRRLSNAEERKRDGGSGVYYHASYWGRPHDYLWLSTTHPALIREELLKAYDTGADKIWILNVGDIKPAEYNTTLFMDLAFDPERFRQPDAYQNHMQDFYRSIFGAENSQQITGLRHAYYDLAWVRKPEFMGWSQTEPTRPTHLTEFEIDHFGNENQHRLDAYQQLTEGVDAIKKELSPAMQASFFQLVEYPIKGAAAMNAKFLNRDQAVYYAETNPKKATDAATQVQAAYDTIVALTEKYNRLENDKWNGIMDFKPRGLPVFELPDLKISKEKDTRAVREAAPLLIQNAASFVEAFGFEQDFPQQLTGLGYSGKAVQLAPATALRKNDTSLKNNPYLSYTLELKNALDKAALTLMTIPNHPITGQQHLQVGVQIDKGPVQIMDFETYGRSEEWKTNVLRNQSRKSVNLGSLKSGIHNLKIYSIDPGVLLDYFILTEMGTTLPYTLPKN
ncbi:glycosyl hydrolase 115 family protein [Leeuwenhoekiella sp.]|uniref:glycosyl hydrolase 115 family protein n=1 Tax=Leeuwenhoekiella sp. TaxID=1977054 RepID=UPI000C3F9DE1|nr:glycosyl hydrolase 115 family protein [Leeuwenhoekiella sp.]MBA82584.1 hypothetical protein [Leeuwenhoekiella sp.]